MPELTAEGERIVAEAAGRHGFSPAAARVVIAALAAGNGNQAQFNHPELGGMGQWSRGGMIMIGDMFNNALKARVDALCTELSDMIAGAAPSVAGLLQSQSQGGGVSLFGAGAAEPGIWWPEDLGRPGAVGSQNGLRYAYFPEARRLALDRAGSVTVRDTGDHRITGFSQQQGGGHSLTFASQHGQVSVADLELLVAPAAQGPAARDADAPARPSVPPAQSAHNSDGVFAALERLAELHRKGVLSNEEFQAKKTELLSRL